MIQIKRDIKKEIESHLNSKEITIITGSRQVGKTFIMNEIISDFTAKNIKTLFLSLDNDSHQPFFVSQDKLLSKIKLEIGDNGFVFIDEIQRIENAGLFLKGIYDRNLNYKFIVSGSGSIELKEKINESLAGRKRLIEMHPVNFDEFVNYKTGYKYEGRLNLFYELEAEKIDELLTEYLNFGGYPRIIIEDKTDEKLKIMHDIFRSYIEKDLVFLLKIDRPDMFSLLIKVMAAQTGTLTNYNKISDDIKLSTPTLKKYLWYAVKTFCLNPVTPYFTNPIKEITKSIVYYFNDIGFRNYSLNEMGKINNNQQFGFIFQNLVYKILRENIQWKNYKINFWRTTDKAEVDFILNKQNEIIPIEVKYGDFKNVNFTRSFRSFIDKYKPLQSWIITRNFSMETTINDCKVLFIPFYQLKNHLS
ncbi:MAG: ATP-binding protein [Bacteroidales bacterium]|nr:ATP-binding protein [Bacteroidales bacterium]